MLAVFFYMGFYNLSSGENLDTIPIAIVEGETTDSTLVSIMETIKISDDKHLFDFQRTNLLKSKELLENDKIAGYLLFDTEPTLIVKHSGLEETIIKSILDSYKQMSQTARNIMTMNPDPVNQDIMKELNYVKNFVVDGGNSSKKPDYTLVYFYTLIALTCLFGTNWGFREILDIQADQSNVGARINVTPVHKLRLLLCNLAAAFTLHFISVLFLLAFLVKVLRIDFTNDFFRILLLCLLGSLCGIALGAMVCVTVKANVKVRSAILNVIVMGGGFLSGMMIVDMKYIISTKAPIISYLNPANLITDAIYCLYYYDDYTKYNFNLIMLGILSIVFCGITYLNIRRREYASI
jgi:ABC-2 type transport system permease protein